MSVKESSSSFGASVGNKREEEKISVETRAARESDLLPLNHRISSHFQMYSTPINDNICLELHQLGVSFGLTESSL